MKRACVALCAMTLMLTPVSAQEKVWRLGVLTPGAAEPTTPGNIRNTTLAVLAERGFREGKNLVYLPAAADGDLSRLPELARTLADQRVDVIVAVSMLAARAAMAASPGTPVVLSFVGEDPVKAGLAESLSRPGGTVTGIFFRGIETDAKRLELLSQALPSARVLGFLATPTLEPERSELLARTAAKLGVSLTTRVVRGPAEYQAAFDAFQAEGVAGVLVMAHTLFASHAATFSRLASERTIATICEWDHMARAGCTFAFGPNLVALRRLTGYYVERIFNGAKPADMPIQLPDRFTLTLNLRAADHLKLTLPLTFLGSVDETIE
jgi:putative tryptophan/tyrosine transport system substrate-binding protein